MAILNSFCPQTHPREDIPPPLSPKNNIPPLWALCLPLHPCLLTSHALKHSPIRQCLLLSSDLGAYRTSWVLWSLHISPCGWTSRMGTHFLLLPTPSLEMSPSHKFRVPLPSPLPDPVL